MSEFDPTIHPHRRRAYVFLRFSCFFLPICSPVNPLTNEYILVSPHRNKRPWLGQVEAPQASNLLQHDPSCYLCPRNTRATEEANPDYVQTYTFNNDFSAILPPPSPSAPPVTHPLFQTQPVHGGCDVLVFHPRHDLTLARLSISEIVNVIDEWMSIYQVRGLQQGVKYVQIFEVVDTLYCLPLLTITEQRLHHGLFESSSPWASMVVIRDSYNSSEGIRFSPAVLPIRSWSIEGSSRP